MNIYNPIYMLAVAEELGRAPKFLRDRYFKTDDTLDVFGTADVLADVRKHSNRAAPFVIPRIGPLPVGRGGFETWELKPANISISRPVTYDDLINRRFGESIMSKATPADRAKRLQAEDIKDLDAMISVREELMCAMTLLDNGGVMRHQGTNAEEYEDVPVKFYDGDSNPASFTPADAWTHSTKSGETWTMGSWYADLKSMVAFLTNRGRPATDILVSPDVGEFLMNDGWIHSVLDNRRMELGDANPGVTSDEAVTIMHLVINGRRMNIIEYSGVYEDASGTETAIIPDGSVIVTAPDVGKGLYGAVTYVKKTGDTGKWVTTAGKRVPQYFVNDRPSSTEIALSAAPLFVPKTINPWCSAKNVLGA